MRMSRNGAAAVISLTLLGACGSKKDEPRPGPGTAAPTPAAADAAPAGMTLTLVPAAPLVGLRQHTLDDVVQDLSILEAGASAPTALRLERQVEKQVEVLEVRGAFRARVRVHYDLATDRQTAGGKVQEQAMPVAGKTYLVAQAADAAPLTITTGDGAPVSDEERQIVDEDFAGELGRLPGMARVLFARTWTERVAVPLDAAAIAEVAADMGAGDQVAALTVTWTGSDAGVASFDFAIDVVRAGGVKMPMKAIVKIDVVNARPVEVHGTATIEGASADGKVTGTMTIHTLNRYQ